MRQGKHWKKTCWKKIRMGLLTASAAVLLMGTTAFAEEEKPYTYTVRINAGKQRELTKDGISRVTVTDSEGGRRSNVSINLAPKGDWLVVEGLEYGDLIYLSPNEVIKPISSESGEEPNESEQIYYTVRGLKMSGRDNMDASEDDRPELKVTGDRDYVIAYSVTEEPVPYTVNYLDMDGNQLLPSDSYFGKPHEEQYVYAQYIEGYQPDYMRMRMTLDKDRENVFNFRYTRIPATGTTTEGGSTTTEATPAPTPGGTGAEGTETPGGGETPTPEGGETPTPPAGGDTNLADENVPQGTQDLRDLDEMPDENVPLSNEALNSDRPGTVMSYLPIYAGIGIAVVVILAAAAFYIKKKGVKVKSAKLPEDILHDEDRK